jgi:serine/threonine protein kinase
MPSLATMTNRWRVDSVLRSNGNATVGEGVDLRSPSRRVVIKRSNSGRKARRELGMLLELEACDPSLVSTAASWRLAEDFEVHFPDKHCREISPDHPSIVVMRHPGSITPITNWSSVRGDGEAAKVMLPAMRCVAELHDKSQVVHMDIKPQNMVNVSGGGERKYTLVDFGLSKYRGEESFGGRGSSMYMSPDVLCRRRFLASPELDAWALGIMLFQATNGELDPYQRVVPGILNEGRGRFAQIAPPINRYDSRMWVNDEAYLAKDLCSLLLHCNPSERITAAEAIRHPLFAASRTTYTTTERSG